MSFCVNAQTHVNLRYNTHADKFLYFHWGSWSVQSVVRSDDGRHVICNDLHIKLYSFLPLKNLHNVAEDIITSQILLIRLASYATQVVCFYLQNLSTTSPLYCFGHSMLITVTCISLDHSGWLSVRIWDTKMPQIFFNCARYAVRKVTQAVTTYTVQII